MTINHDLNQFESTLPILFTDELETRAQFSIIQSDAEYAADCGAHI